MRTGRRFWLGIMLAAWSVPALAAPVITGINVEAAANGGERVVFQTESTLTANKAFALNNPERIVIDIPKVAATGIALPPNYRGRLIKSIRFGQFDPQTSRIVLDLNAPGKVVSTSPGSPLVVEIAPVTPLAQNATPAPASQPAAAPVAQKPLVIIDAGHGGQDPGAIGLHSTHEKDVTLNFARTLRAALLANGRYRVMLTRDDDRFVMLGERVNIARRAKGDIFISFHADSNPRPEARGLSIYTLSETASDDEAAQLAERENKSDIISGLDLNTTDADVASILIDLTQRETMNKSATLADSIVASMNGKVNKLESAHRFAGFRVLKAPDIPSVLIELGFLTNANDERLLLSPDYRDAVISSVVKGIDRYRAAE